MKHVLILCTANSARSILGEAILNQMGNGRFKAYSAGSHPRGTPNPRAIALLDSLGYPTADLRSKSWDEYSGPEAQAMDIVITVCDAAAGEACPYWPGAPVRAHWGIPDPAAIEGSAEAQLKAFQLAHDRLKQRFSALVALPVESMTADELNGHLREIAKLEGATEKAKGTED